ncbi:MAG: IPT/TIG domain-containing protein [Alphaproteobacteria bacterium]
MINWRKLMRSAQLLLPSVIFIFAATDCSVYCPSPGLSSISPNIGNQGDTVTVTITGSNFVPECGAIDPVIQTDYIDLVPDPPSRWDSTSITFNLHIAANAYKGAHYLAVRNNHGISEYKPFFVTCPGCPPPPELVYVVNETGSPLMPGGPPVTFRFVGTNFLNRNPRIQIANGISFPPGPYSVQGGGGGYDYFLVPLTADANAYTGTHFVEVVTDDGISNNAEVVVDAYQPPPSPTPGSPPVLNKVTPTQIPSGSIQPLYIKLEGSGFGQNREVLIDGYPGWVNTLPTYQENPDTIAVAMIRYSNFPSTGPLTVRVHNLDNNTTSDGLILLQYQLGSQSPFVGGISPPGVNLGGDADVFIGGSNLNQVNEQSFSGIPGLTFSSVHSDPNYPPELALWVHVHADANTPVSGDSATNLIITTTDGHSEPFAFGIGARGFGPEVSAVTPTGITKADSGVSVKVHGAGFGTAPQIYLEPNNTISSFTTLGTIEANPDQVVVGVTSPNPASTDRSVTVHVINTQTRLVSDGAFLYLDERVPGAPYVSYIDYGTSSIQRNGDADLTIHGENLQGVTEQSFHGIPGLTFSNVQPGNPPDTSFSVHVHADASTPLTGDEATNLTVTTPNGQSNPSIVWIFP